MDQNNAQSSLVTAYEQLQAVTSCAPIVLFSLDKEGVFTLSDGLGLKSLGLEPGQVVGQSSFDVYQAYPEIIQSLHRALKGDSFSLVVNVEGIVFDTHYAPLLDAQGEFIGTIGVATEITERSLAEKSLRESEDKFAKSFRAIPDAVSISTVADGTLIDINEGFTLVTGYASSEVIGKPTTDLGLWIHPEQRDAMREALMTEGRVSNLEIQARHKSGEILDCLFSAESIEVDGKPCLISLVKDITERKRASAELRQKEHEIRKAYADVFSAVTEEKLLILTQAEMDKALGHPITEEYVVPTFEQLSESRQHLREVLSEHLPDQDMIGDVILASGEAIANGVKHAGSCQVQVYRLDGSIQIRVTDQGHGIDFSDLPKATLLTGFSTKKSLGMGFSVLLDICDSVLLLTSSEGTTVVLEVGGKKEEESNIDDILSRGLFKEEDVS